MELNQWQFFTFAAIIIIPISFKLLINLIYRCKTLPPGPWGFPVVGYVPFLGKNPIDTFLNVSKKYGKIFSVNLGNETAVVLNDWDSIKEALVNQPKAFSGRPYSFAFYSLAQGKDIATNNGSAWKAQRKLTMHILRSLGVGKKSMESGVMDLVHEIIDTLTRVDGKSYCMASLFFGPILKTNWNLVSSLSLPGNVLLVECNFNEDFIGNGIKHSSELKEFEDLVANTFEALYMLNPVNNFPWLRFFPPNGFGYWRHMRKNEQIFSYLNKVVDEHVAEWEEGRLDDFIDCYLSEIKKQKAINGNEEIPFNIDYVSFTLYDLFMAGVEPTNGTSLWGFLHLALNPSIQKKAQDELDEVVGRHRLPNLSDMPRLPYVDALVMEIHRIASLVPFSVPHKTTENVKLFGYTIPKDTTVIQNISAVHNDPKLWDEPKLFNPQRFIDANNKAKAPPYFMPFSLGPRVCPGQTLAEMELRLIFSCLLHQFSFSLPQNQPIPSLEPVISLTLKPHPYSLIIRKRKE